MSDNNNNQQQGQGQGGQNQQTAEQVEQLRRQAEEQERNKTITVDGQTQSLQNTNTQGGQQPQQQPAQNQQQPTDRDPNSADAPKPKAPTGNQVQKVVLQTQYAKIEITDPNILDELNEPGKYATSNIPFKALEFNINQHGGRIRLVAEDKKEVDREILSGVGKKETANNPEMFKLVREGEGGGGGGGQQPQPTQ